MYTVVLSLKIGYCFVFLLEPFMIGFMKTVYTVIESEGQVKVCVNLTHPLEYVFDFTVLVESYNNESSLYNLTNTVIASESSLLTLHFDFISSPYFLQLLTLQTSLENTLSTQGLTMRNR